MKLKIPPTGMNLCGYEIASGKKPGRPKSWAGNFAVVVPAEKICNGNNEGNFALRFFLAKTPSHITQITSFINNNPHPSLVGCKMYRSMLTMKDGEKVDMMEMDFVSGTTIDDWIKDAMANGQHSILSALAEAIRESVNELVGMGFYHGDLSHSNIMIEDGFRPGSEIKSQLKFIDYDSVLVSSVKNPPHTKETGHPNFQHPSRKASRFTMLEDVYFSSVLIYVSLIALSVSPGLWDKYHSKGDNIIFQNQKGDLRITNTPLWEDLERINFPGETKKAFLCLKKAVENQQLVGSHFLSEIEEWFSTGSHNPTPTPKPTPIPPTPNPEPDPPEIQPSPKPRPRTRTSSPSPKPRPKGKATRGAESPKVRKKTKDKSSSLINQKDESIIGVPGDSKIKKNDEGSSIFNSVKNMLRKRDDKEAKPSVEDSKLPPKGSSEKPDILRPKLKESITKKEGRQKKPSKKSKKKSPYKSTTPVSLTDLKSKKVVIDGANILHEACTLSDFRMEPLMDLISDLEKADVESVHVVFDASTPHKLTKGSAKEELYEMIDQNRDRFTIAPKATEADAIILNIAKKTGCIIITNDFYNDYKEKLPEEYDWFTKHHITASNAMSIWTLNTTPRNEFIKR